MNIKNKIIELKEKISTSFEKRKHDCTCSECHCDDHFDYDNIGFVDGDIEFIWGVKSVSDYTHEYACLGSMNDIDIIYDKESKLFHLNLLTHRVFEKDKKDEVRFLKRVLSEFTDYMKAEEYDTEYRIPFAFNHINDIVTFSGEDLAELYAKFKLFVTGFVAMYG